jgi:hypothetical protein
MQSAIETAQLINTLGEIGVLAKEPLAMSDKQA